MSQSQARNFGPDTLAMVSVRCILGLHLLAHSVVRKRLLKLIQKFAKTAQVDVVATAILANHFHLILRQRKLIGHDKRRKRGIAPFMRNVLSRLSRGLRHPLHPLKGRKFETTYHSDNLHSREDVARALAYVLGQAVNHRLRPEHVWESSSVLAGIPDGVISHLPALCQSDPADPDQPPVAPDEIEPPSDVQRQAHELNELIQEIISESHELLTNAEHIATSETTGPSLGPATPAVWREATQHALARRGLADCEIHRLDLIPTRALASKRHEQSRRRLARCKLPALRSTNHVDPSNPRLILATTIEGPHANQPDQIESVTVDYLHRAPPTH